MRIGGSWFVAVFGGVFAFLTFASTSYAATIFTDFGPGDSYSSSGYVVSTAASVEGLTITSAMGFTSAINADVTEIDIAIQNAAGTNSGTTISLHLGSDTGPTIGSWVLGTLPSFSTSGPSGITTISGITGTHLIAGDTYFLVAVAANDDFNAWNLNDQGVNGTVAQNGVAFDNQTLGAFDVLGASTAATPLPAALPLFATGLGGLGLLGWRRKRAQAA
jgi:hypothetical protein